MNWTELGKSFFASLLQASVFVLVIAWLGRNVVRTWLDKSLDKYRIDRQAARNESLESYKMQLQVEQKRREATSRLAELLHLVYFEPDLPTPEEYLKKFGRMYWELVPWLPKDVIAPLSACIGNNGHLKDDVRPLLECMRRLIAGEELGDGDERRAFSMNMLNVEAVSPRMTQHAGGPGIRMPGSGNP